MWRLRIPVHGCCTSVWGCTWSRRLGRRFCSVGCRFSGCARRSQGESDPAGADSARTCHGPKEADATDYLLTTSSTTVAETPRGARDRFNWGSDSSCCTGISPCRTASPAATASHMRPRRISHLCPRRISHLTSAIGAARTARQDAEADPSAVQHLTAWLVRHPSRGCVHRVASLSVDAVQRPTSILARCTTGRGGRSRYPSGNSRSSACQQVRCG